MRKVLVAGATGYLGKYVVQEFKRQGYWVRALARNSAKLTGITDFINDLFIGEITNPISLTGVCDDIDIVFSSIGITKQRDGLSFMDVDFKGNLNLLEEAKEANVTKFIYTSVFNAEKMKDLKVIQAKLKFEEALKQSGLDYKIIYPNGFFSDMLEYLRMAESGRGYIIGSGENLINPIHGKDLAKVCVNAVDSGRNKINVGGPDILSHNKMIKLAFETVGKKEKISRIPVWLSNLFVGILRIFTPVKIYGPVEFFMTVLKADLVAPVSGQYHLKDFYLENKNNG